MIRGIQASLGNRKGTEITSLEIFLATFCKFEKAEFFTGEAVLCLNAGHFKLLNEFTVEVIFREDPTKLLTLD